MASPSEQVTQNAQRFIGLDQHVIFAMRVEWGMGTETPTMAGALGTWSIMRIPLVMPLIALVRSRATMRTMRDDRNAGCGILALTADDGRILLSAMPFRRKIPTGFVETLPKATPLLVDVEWMENYVVPRLTVGEREVVVNGVDFKALLKAVEEGTVRSIELAANLDRLKSVGLRQYG